MSTGAGISSNPKDNDMQTPQHQNHILSLIKSESIETDVNLLETNAHVFLSVQHKDDMCRPNFTGKYALEPFKEPKPEPVPSKPKRILYCKYCPRTFKFRSQLIVHERIHTGEKPFPCLECGKQFTKKSNLNLHLKVHGKNKLQIQCSHCPIKFAYSDYFAHMKSHFTNVEIAEKCKHMQLFKGNSKSETIETNAQRQEQKKNHIKQKKLICQYCGKNFRFQSALVRHERVHTGEKPYKCDICSKAFGQAYFLRVHELTHWSVKRYNCTRCGKAFVHYSNAKNHSCRPTDHSAEALNTEKPDITYTCHICRKVFDHLQLFKSHMTEHTGEQLYHCLKCDKLFGVFAEFSAHEKECIKNMNSQPGHPQPNKGLINKTLSVTQYNGFKRLSDYDIVSSSNMQKKEDGEKECKTLPTSNTLLQATVTPARPLSHIVSCLNSLDTSSDPRKYFCPSCGRLFRHMGRLRAHMLTHKRDQSYTCTRCGKTLENWKKLWLHQRVHRRRDGRFRCPLCGRGFRFVKGYKRHMGEHADFRWVPIGDRKRRMSLPFKCEQCTCKFRTKKLLFQHQRCHAKFQDKLPVLKSTFDSVPKQSVRTCKTDKSIPDQIKKKKCENSYLMLLTSFDENTSTELSVESPKQSSGKISDSIEGSSECAICGQTCSVILDLYLHYLQHARGEVRTDSSYAQITQVA